MNLLLLIGARKIPRVCLAFGLVQWLAAALAPAWGQQPDTSAVLKRARRAESEYESSIRRFAPNRRGVADSRTCDENVGRFCIIYDTGLDELPPEPGRVATARDSAIAALSRAFPVMPANARVAYSLVRLLVVAKRADDAVDIARAYARASGASDTHMLLGFALHADRQTEMALKEFDVWLAAMSERERERVTDFRWLLAPVERRRFERLSRTQQADYAARAWRFADPLYLTSGNELLADHYARQALTKMLTGRSAVIGNEAWGKDVEELIVRFGIPIRTTRHMQNAGSLNSLPGYSEHWDPVERAYFPPDPLAVQTLARVDTIWPIDSLTSRSGHAPSTIRLMRVLEHQAARLVGNQLVVAGSTRLDSAARGRAHPTGRLFALDSTFNVIADAGAAILAFADSVTFRASLDLPAAARFYSAELLDTTTRLAARARYPVPQSASMPPLSLSGLLLCAPFQPGALPADRDDERLRPLVRPVLAAGAQFGVYGEIRSTAATRRTIRIELETRSTNRRWAVARLGAWIGSKLGLAGPSSSARLGWVLEVEPGVITPVALTVDAGRLPPGRYQVVVKARDTAAAAEVASVREFVVVATGTGAGSAPQ